MGRGRSAARTSAGSCGPTRLRGTVRAPRGVYLMLASSHSAPATTASSLSSPHAPTLMLMTIPTMSKDQEVGGEGEAKGLGGLEIDDELEVHRLLDGQISRLGAFQDSVHIVGTTLERIRQRRPVGHEAPILGKHPEFVHRRQSVLGRKVQDLTAMRQG